MSDIKLNKEDTSGIIGFFARNPVAANLLMGFIIVMGLMTYFTMQRQMFPNINLERIQITASYPGASPQEIEEGIIVKIEDRLRDVTELKEVVSRAHRNYGTLTLRVDSGADLAEVVDKVKNKVDAISSFPSAMEPINVESIEVEQGVMELLLVGDQSYQELKGIARDIERELLALNNVTLVRLMVPNDEVSVEVEPEMLRQYGLTISDVSNAIRRTSNNYSAGQILTDSGVISVRVENKRYDGDSFRNIPVKIGDDGSRVLLSDVANVRDGFVEGEFFSKYSGKDAVFFSIRATETQNVLAVADSLKQYIKQKNESLGPDLKLEVLVDMTYYLQGRLDMMIENLLLGAVLVALMLTIFLRFKLALWVMVGLPVCFLGAVMMMPVMGVTINILSLFAFIMVLGIVVDDAIVIGESVYTEIEKKGKSVTTVITGAKRVATPATFGVLTTIAVFAPSLFSTGPERAFFYTIAAVAILCLIFSLIESKLILPAHLAHTKFKPVKPNGLRDRFNRRFEGFIHGPYKRFVTRAIAWRWVTLGAFIAFTMISVSLLSANHVRVVQQPKVPHDYLDINVEMVQTASDEMTINAIKTVESVVMAEDERIESEYGAPMIANSLTLNRDRTRGLVLMPLVLEENRPVDTFELARRVRSAMPAIPGVKSIFVRDDVNQGDNGDFSFVIYGTDFDSLNAAARFFAQKLQGVDGLFDISTTIDPAGKELRMELKPVAYDLGLTIDSISSQTGASYYGGEAQRFIRDTEEVRVMVKYPRLSRERVADLKYTMIKTPSGNEVMLGDVVDFVEMPGISYIRRVGGYRSVYIWGNIDEERVEPDPVIKEIRETLLKEVVERFPKVKSDLGQSVKEQQAQQNEQILFAVAGLLMVFILLAVPLKSYSQPLIVMSVIPFSLTGAIWGHFFLGLDLSMMSFFGLIAAAGVVINDSLVMTDYVNQRIKEGVGVLESVTEAGCARFRAITLTSITTFAGVLPSMFETSLQAQFVIPMAAGLGFAVLFATIVSLLLVPCLYIILEDIKGFFAKYYGVSKAFVRGLFVSA